MGPWRFAALVIMRKIRTLPARVLPVSGGRESPGNTSWVTSQFTDVLVVIPKASGETPH